MKDIKLISFLATVYEKNLNIWFYIYRLFDVYFQMAQNNWEYYVTKAELSFFFSPVSLPHFTFLKHLLLH